MINFCHGALKPLITCDKVCADDYGVENLISGNDYWSSQRGFRAERFIVPPVSVTVRFPVNIQIAKIIIDPVVGRQKSSGLELFACSRRRNKSWLFEDNTDSIRCSPEEEIFGSVGKVQLCEPTVVCFENPAYTPRTPFVVFRYGSSKGGKSSMLKQHPKASLFSVSAVTIRIFQTVERSAPALKRLEIWGQPVPSCPRQLQAAIFQLYSNTRSANNSSTPVSGASVQSTTHSAEESFCKTPSDLVSNGESSVAIPDEFIDPITCDIMTVPLTLPSGKTIDQRTLDKHIEAESKWGRPPSDPFTGVPFSAVKKPVSNVSLKLRIDGFVLNHSSELKTVPRVLGRGENARWSQDSLHSAVQPRYNEDFYPKQQPLQTSVAVKRKCDSFEKFNTKVAKLEVGDTNTRIDSQESSNHEIKLSQSLDTALFAALGGLPSFQAARTTLKKESVCQPPQDNLHTSDMSPYTCIYCNKSIESQTLYTLACDHFSCRKCLSKTFAGASSGVCHGCGKPFCSKDVARLNV